MAAGSNQTVLTVYQRTVYRLQKLCTLSCSHGIDGIHNLVDSHGADDYVHFRKFRPNLIRISFRKASAGDYGTKAACFLKVCQF